MTMKELFVKSGVCVDCSHMSIGGKRDIIDILKSFGLDFVDAATFDLRNITRIGNVYSGGRIADRILLGNGLPTPEQSKRLINFYELFKAVDLDEKVELKDGDKITLRGYENCWCIDGVIWSKDEKGDMIPRIAVNRFDDKFQYLGNRKQNYKFEIMEITRDGETIFQRDSVTEVSMKEIADWKGVDVKDIRIKD